jgi:hypothetical protein
MDITLKSKQRLTIYMTFTLFLMYIFFMFDILTNTSFSYSKEKALIEWIKTNKIKVLNSGIKIA